MKYVMIAAAAIVTSTAANSATLSDVDYSSLSWSRTSLVDNGAGTNDSATGVSNGVGFSFSGALFAGFSNLTTFNDLPSGAGSYLDIHAGSVFTITFDAPITSILFALGNDNRPGVMGIDFGILASDTKDVVSRAPTTPGGVATDYRVQDIRGGLVLYEFDTAITSLTQQIPSTGDGFDMVFFANAVDAPQVPLPAAGWMLIAGLGGLLALRRRT